MSLEKFIAIVGAQRSGTSYLSGLLDEHPGIFMAKPIKPEPKFFLQGDEFNKGKEYYLNKYFSEVVNHDLIFGEKSTSYIEFPEVATRINQYFEKAKILIILRNPVQRALSNYYFSVNNGLESRTLNEVFVENRPLPELKYKTSVNPFLYLERSKYLDYIIPFKKAFGDRLKILIFEELVGNIREVEELYSFVGASEFTPSKLNKVVNSSEKEKEADSSVINQLEKILIPEVERLEAFMNRKINVWHDKI